MSLTWIAVALSQVTPTHRSPMPRMVKLDEVKLVLVKVTLGSVCWSAGGLTICCFSSVLGGEGADRDRHVLQPLRLALRGDDDVAAVAVRAVAGVGASCPGPFVGAVFCAEVVAPVCAAAGSARQQHDRRRGKQLELLHRSSSSCAAPV